MSQNCSFSVITGIPNRNNETNKVEERKKKQDKTLNLKVPLQANKQARKQDNEWKK